MNDQNTKTPPSTSRILARLLCSVLVLGRSAMATDMTPSRWWADFGLGYGSMSAGSSAISNGGNGLWLELQLGGRLNGRWLAGFNLGGIGINPSDSNYDPNNHYSSVYGETITNEFLAVQYEPKSDHGWIFGAAGGPILYGNKALEDITGNSHSGNGWAVLGRTGYDWGIRENVHLEAVLSLEQGRVSLSAPLTGQFDFTVIAASLHLAYH